MKIYVVSKMSNFDYDHKFTIKAAFTTEKKAWEYVSESFKLDKEKKGKFVSKLIEYKVEEIELSGI